MAQSLSFTHTIEQHDDRILIRSFCSHCGTSRLVSVSDGSIHLWESTHNCRTALPDKKPFVPAKIADHSRVNLIAMAFKELTQR